MSVVCESCNHPVAVGKDGRLPPWCSHCGKDLKRTSTGSKVTPVLTAPSGPQSVQCPACGQPLRMNAQGRLPPWCGACGAEPNQASATPVAPASLPVPASGLTVAGPVADPSSGLTAREWDERFGWHNVAVGLGLAAWSGFLSFIPREASPVEKALASHQTLNAILVVLQCLTIGNGLALFASGLAIRHGRSWGYPVAVGCAMIGVVIGMVFLTTFQHLGQFEGLVNAVARVYYLRDNLDMLIGLVDGLGLLWFLNKYRAQAATAAATGGPPARSKLAER